ARTEALLLPQLGPGASEHDLKERWQRPAATAMARKDGFFQLVDVPPGTYLLEARSPGFAPARVSSVAVVVGSESWLQVPLVLRRPLDLTFTLDPPRDWLDRPWHVTVARASDLGGGYSGKALFDGDAATGEGRLRDSAPGLYAVTAADTTGNRMLYLQDIAIEGAADASQTLTISLVRVKGKALLGDKPLAATLWFGGRSGAKRVGMESGEDGNCVGMLPDNGRWTVEVSAAERAIKAGVSVTVF